MQNFKKKMSLAVLISSFSLPIYAQGIILNNNDLRTDLNWLNQQGVIQISTSTWPLSGDEIERALKDANITNPLQEKVINSVRSFLAADNNLIKLSLYAESDPQYFPQHFADTKKSQYQAGVELNAGGASWDGKLKINAEKDQMIPNARNVNVEGSYLAGKLGNQWFIAGQIPTYWGPGHDGSLIRGDASRPVYGLTLQRAEQKPFETKWLSWAGNWQYQIFAGRLDDYKAVPDTNLLGLRLTAQPLSYLELGASRVLQIDGQGQPDSFKAYWNAFIGKDNECDASGCVGEKNASNQLAGLDVRLNLQEKFELPLSLYMQFVGEDESGLLPSRKMYLGGLDYSSQIKNIPFQVYMEWANTQTNRETWGYSYNHHNYKDGYYQHGFPLGHPLGGDGEMYSLGGDIRFDAMNRLNGRLMYAKVNQSALEINQAFLLRDRFKTLDLTWTHYLRSDVPLKISGWITDSESLGNDSGVSIGIEIPLDASLFN